MFFGMKGGAVQTVLALSLATFVGACGDDEVAEDGGVSGASGAGGSGGGEDNGGCLDPLAEHMVFAPRAFTDDSLIYNIVEDDGTLFFSTLAAIHRVDAAGGEPEMIYNRPETIVPQFWVRADDVLVLEVGRRFMSVPKDGGDPVELGELPFRVDSSLAGELDMIVEGDFAYARVSTTYFEIDLTTYEAREIIAGSVGYNEPFAKSGDALYVTERDPSVGDVGPTGFAPDFLHRIPIAGGEPEIVPIDGDPQKLKVWGATGDMLWLAARGEQITSGGFYRLPTSGGALDEVRSTLVLFGTGFQIINTSGPTLMRDLNSVYELPTSGEGRRLFCLGGNAYTTHSIASNGEYVWSSLFHSDDELAFIVRMPIQ